MLDIRKIKENPEEVKRLLRAKEVDCDEAVDRILALDLQRRELIASTEAKKAEQNKVSKQIPVLKKQNETLAKQAQDAIAVSELLQKAIALNDEGDNEGLAQVLAQIAPMKELLSATELELYESLVVD